MKNLNLQATDRNLDYTQVEQILTNQIKSYITNAKAKTCIVGVSGGIDSAVVSTLAAKTGLITVLLTMPIHQNINEVNRAHEHITKLQSQYSNIVHKTIDLTQTYEQMKIELQQGLGKTEEDLYMSLVNTRSRLRMGTLYGAAQAYGGLVMGTGNKVEDYGIGFFTKYGDGGVDYSPIGELTKTEVKNLARHMGVVDSIIQAKPTDGLHPTGATDEDQIGATYEELERAMEHYDLGERSQNYKSNSREYEVMSIYTNRHEANAHKMQTPPIAKIYS